MSGQRVVAVTGWIVALAAIGVAAWSTMQTGQLKTQLRYANLRADSLGTSSSVRDWIPPGHGADSAGSVALETFWREQATKAQSQGNNLLGEVETASLRKRGLHNPAEDLRRDLVAHPELIPYQSTGGGYRFFPELAVLLPGYWVSAYFEDGHVPGYLLLSYEVESGGRILWKVVDSKLLN